MSFFHQGRREPAWRRKEQARAERQQQAQARARRARFGIPEPVSDDDHGFAQMTTTDGSSTVTFTGAGFNHRTIGADWGVGNGPSSQHRFEAIFDDWGVGGGASSQRHYQQVISRWQNAAHTSGMSMGSTPAVSAAPERPRSIRTVPTLRSVWKD